MTEEEKEEINFYKTLAFYTRLEGLLMLIIFGMTNALFLNILDINNLFLKIIGFIPFLILLIETILTKENYQKLK